MTVLHAIVLCVLPLFPLVDASMLRRLETMKYMEAMLSPPRPACYIENGFDYVGNDIGNFPARVDKCCDQCAQFSGCNAWSWSNYNGGTCWFKSARGEIVVNKDVKSALLFRGGYQLCEKIYDTDYVDNDIGNQPSASADGCCDICHGTLGCRAYSWTNQNGGTCWLKSKAGQAIYKPGVISAQAYPGRPDPQQCSLIHDADFPGNDITNRPSSDPSGCCALCKGVTGCVGYSWSNYNGGTCWLKSWAQDPVHVVGVVSSIVVANPMPCTYQDNVDFVDNDIANAPGVNVAACCPLCHARSGCTAFTWSDYNGGTCWLKSRGGATVSKPGVKSGVIVMS
ncbi:hypothetical protein PINS_up000897 [Pythium insidiosum]|nr:hypothetical protein PINS_up000897 [Pythium insidiosum]